MSLFAGEQPVLGVFSTVNAPTIAVPQVAPATGLGAGIALVVPVGTMNLANAVTNVNPIAATALMTYAFPAGSLNLLNRIVDVFAAGEMTTGAETAATQTYAITLNDGTNTRTVATWTTQAQTASQTSVPWEIELVFETTTAGTSGKVFGHGSLSIPLTPAGAIAGYLDTNTAATSTLDLTQKVTMSVTMLFASTNASNSVTQDMMVIEFEN